MSIKEYVQRSREEKRQMFGEIGLHDDCLHYGTTGGVPVCDICLDRRIEHRHKPDEFFLQCQMGMCYFYEPKEERQGE